MPFIRRFVASFSTVGLILGLALFCASLTPSLLPREFVAQGVLSGVVFAAGYGMGKAGHWLWRFMQLRNLTGRFARISTWILVVALALCAVYTLGRMTVWQSSIRLRMEMAPIDSAYPLTVSCVAIVTALAVILLLRLLLSGVTKVVDAINHYLPRRIAIVLGGTAFVLLLLSLVDGLILKRSLQAMDESFAIMNRLLDEEYDMPRDDRASGSARSLIAWSDIGRNGKRYVADGPAKEEIASILGREAMQPIRVYAGFDTGDTLEERAQIALAELKRVGGFNRSTLVATPTGTGWLDPSAVDTVEFIHVGDIATVTLQYSYLPSWLTLMVEPALSRRAARALFDAVYGYWTRLPRDARPELYLHGLSLGALGSEDSADLITMIADPIDGALWSGPPFPSSVWSAVTRNRNPGSPQWRPTFRDSAAIRFMTQDGFPDLPGAEWGPMRIVYLQHASDPMSFFSPDLAYAQPDWLAPEGRGPDVSPYLRWFPVVTFFQVAFDIPMATSVPLGYGHNFAPANYIDAWIEVTQPRNWGAEDTAKLKTYFVGFDPSPL